LIAWIRPRIEAAAPLPWLGIVRIADALGDRTGVEVAVIDLPAFLTMIDGSAAGERGHGRSFVRLACFRDAGSALQDSRLLNDARKVRDGHFVDGRRLRLFRLPDFRQVFVRSGLSGSGVPWPVKAHAVAAGKSSID
jgi:hypothetical protein